MLIKMDESYFTNPIARHIWDIKYRHREAGEARDATLADTWGRIASALAANEPRERAQWQARFYSALAGFKFLPGGRKVVALGGMKSLYSDSYFTPEQFWRRYNKAAYDRLKQKYDPGHVFKDIYRKCVLKE